MVLIIKNSNWRAIEACETLTGVYSLLWSYVNEVQVLVHNKCHFSAGVGTYVILSGCQHICPLSSGVNQVTP